ncbi:MAG TPA: MFS transporter [Bryobacteraceae bacterium]|jgi:nitrate/nitrite transporter NarK|nr:MFS transporter [Bryobacteraceae bacterium]
MPVNQTRALACVCAVGFAFSANYTNHAPVVPALIAEFHFNQALAGLLTTGIFLTHAATQVPGGHLADRLGPMRVLRAAMAVVCLGNFGIGFANAYWQLLFWKIFVGLGTGTSFVAGARYIANIFSGPQLHRVQGLYGGSILLGSGFVIFAVPQFLAAFGWRTAFFSTATVATLVLAGWMLAAPPPEHSKHLATSFGGMLADRRLWVLGVIQMASFGLVIVVGAWIAALLRGSLGLSPARAGLIGSLVLLLGIFTRPLGGALVPRVGVRRLLAGSLLITAAGCFLLGAPAPTSASAVAAVLLLGLGCGLPYAALFNRAAALYPGRAGAAMGLVNMLGIVMILAGAPLAGHLADWTGSFRAGFLALGLFALVACAGTATSVE